MDTDGQKICVHCERPKGKSFFRPSDWKSKYGACRDCRRNEPSRSLKRDPQATPWRQSNARFFGQARRTADEQMVEELRSLNRIAGGFSR
jgi:hypothetical protein